MILISRKQYSFEEVKENKFDNSVGEWAYNILRFCHDWLNGLGLVSINTSGSTGKPKEIALTRKQLKASAQQTIEALELKKGDKALVCINTDYIGGKMMLVRGMEAGFKLHVIPPSSNPLSDCEGIERYDFMALVPLQLNQILNSSEKEKDILNRAKAIIIGGAAVNTKLLVQCQKINTPLFSTYGMTETVSHIALKRLNGDEKSEYYSLLPGISIGKDDRGCLTIKGAVTANETIVTNDLVTIHDNNEFEITGRVDNIINSGGIKIQLEKIEKAVEKIFMESQIDNKFVVVGLEDDVLEQKLVLIIEGVKTNIRKYEEVFFTKLNSYLTKYEIPKKVFYLDQFPELASGKIDKKKIVSLVTK